MIFLTFTSPDIPYSLPSLLIQWMNHSSLAPLSHLLHHRLTPSSGPFASANNMLQYVPFLRQTIHSIPSSSYCPIFVPSQQYFQRVVFSGSIFSHPQISPEPTLILWLTTRLELSVPLIAKCKSHSVALTLLTLSAQQSWPLTPAWSIRFSWFPVRTFLFFWFLADATGPSSNCSANSSSFTWLLNVGTQCGDQLQAICKSLSMPLWSHQDWRLCQRLPNWYFHSDLSECQTQTGSGFSGILDV